MYGTKQKAKDLIWHACDREVDGHLCHSTNSPLWKLMDISGLISQINQGIFD